MDDPERPVEGETATHTRTFTNEEVRAFADLSGDEGYHHVVDDEDGPVVVHGLLTATLPTKLGGDMDFLARTMEFEFPRPLYTGVEVTCESTVEAVVEREDRYEMTASFVCETADGQVVLRGETDGVVFK